MLIAEELLLVRHLDTKGNLYNSADELLDLTVSGGILAELFLAGRIRIQAGRLVVVDSSSAGDPLLDEALTRLLPGNSVEPEDPEWVGPIIAQLPFGRRLLDRLIHQDILRREEKRTLGILRGYTYLLQNPAVRQRLIDQERQVMIDGVAPDARSATLIFMIGTLGDVDPPKQSRKEKKVYQDRWEELFGDYWGQMPSGQPAPIAGLDPAARQSLGALVVSLGVGHSYMFMGGYSSYE